MKAAIVIAISLTAAGAIGLAVWPGLGTANGLPYLDRAVTRQGQEVYNAHCAACHGADLQGQENWRSRDEDGFLPAPPHDATGHTWHHPSSQLIAITAQGTEEIVGGGYRSRMAGYRDILTYEEIVAVLAFIKSTWPQDVIEIHNRIDADANG